MIPFGCPSFYRAASGKRITGRRRLSKCADDIFGEDPSEAKTAYQHRLRQGWTARNSGCTQTLGYSQFLLGFLAKGVAGSRYSVARYARRGLEWYSGSSTLSTARAYRATE